jgi:hypothetical protein
LAKAQRVTRSQLVERLLRDALDPEEMAVKAFTNPQIMTAFGRAFSAPGVLRQMVEVLGEELQPEQLELFQNAMEELATGGSLTPAPPPVAAKPTPPAKRGSGPRAPVRRTKR